MVGTSAMMGSSWVKCGWKDKHGAFNIFTGSRTEAYCPLRKGSDWRRCGVDLDCFRVCIRVPSKIERLVNRQLIPH